jgi:hypothetical protein
MVSVELGGGFFGGLLPSYGVVNFFTTPFFGRSAFSAFSLALFRPRFVVRQKLDSDGRP